VRYSEIEKSQWPKFFSVLSKRAEGQQVELEIADPDFGDQIAEEWTHLEGIFYNEGEDILYIETSGFEHVVLSPLQTVLVEDQGTLQAVCVKDTRSRLQILLFREPLKLEAPSWLREVSTNI
jgi:hypothetical protein